ncbi:hypothetical protein AB0C34_16960 [Nocardia sp. NPDC049220]|uniref:hypothetical protein n=1 Tax=Nocardia sp. NPDC049220 TaxID=3155273 RepID=UPI0033CA02CE
MPRIDDVSRHPSAIHSKMNRDHAARWFRFPPQPRPGGVWTAADGSIWTFSTYAPWWHLTEKAVNDDTGQAD